MQAHPFATMMRSLVPPGLQRVAHTATAREGGCKAVAGSHAVLRGPVDFLFLYRTEKKRRYFSSLSRGALADHRCLLASYHNLPPAPPRPLPPERMAVLLAMAERELFNARIRHWSLCLRPLLLGIRRHQISKMHTRLRALLDAASPGVIVLWNGSKFQDFVLHEANRRSIPVLYFENGVLPGTTTVDARGINAANSVPRDPARFRDFAPSAKSHAVAPLKDRQPRRHFGRKARSGRGLDCSGAVFNILVPFQKERDTQILDHSHWIKSMSQLVGEVRAAIAASGLRHYRLWLREHPSAATRYPALYREVAQSACIDFANGGRLANWLAGMDLVITVNSSVGLEALTLGKPVVTLGDAFYNIPGLVDHADSAAQLCNALLRARDKPPMDEVLRRGFLGFLAEQYATAGDWRAPDDHHWQAVRKRMLAALAAGAPASPVQS